MKRKLIIAMVFVNAALLIALAVGTAPQQAKAQTFPTTDYLMFTAQMTQVTEGVCVVDLGSMRMMTWRLRQQGRRYALSTVGGGRDLARDFGRKKAVGGP